MNRVQKIGFIGLGRMGLNMVGRILEGENVDVIAWGRNAKSLQSAVDKGAQGSSSVEELLAGLKQDKRVVWLMLPAGEVTEDYIQIMLRMMEPGDIIIDGANSYFKDSVRRHKEAKSRGLSMLDVGVSGGIIAAKTGYPMMIGGDKETYEFCKPVFESLGGEAGYGLLGGPGAGHYVKMVHNAVEYGMMQAIAEGFDLLEHGTYEQLDLESIANIWNRGTIISSFLMEMVERVLKGSDLEYLKPFVEDSGEGRWAAEEAIGNAVPFVANTYALQARFISRDRNSTAFRILAAMRHEFGGHEVKR
jgi:6-phosphogluconate dehydrogenase